MEQAELIYDVGHKVDPRGIRLKITDTWKSRWFASGKDFNDKLEEDTKIREFLRDQLAKAGVFRIDIERLNEEIHIHIHSTRPGMIIGKGGSGIEDLQKQLKNKLRVKKNTKINIKESKNVNLESKVWADQMAEQIEKRMPFRRVMKNAIEQIMDAGAKGARLAVSGRLNGADIARTEWLYRGKLPLHTMRADIDFAKSTAYTTYGTIGIKVWINKGEIFEDVHPGLTEDKEK